MKFINNLKSDEQLDKLAKLLAELEIFSMINEKLPCELSDEQWEIYLHIEKTQDRKQFLNAAHFEEILTKESETSNAMRTEVFSHFYRFKIIRFIRFFSDVFHYNKGIKYLSDCRV